MYRRLSAPCLVAALAALGGGCNASFPRQASLEIWQKEMERYVADRSAGDVNALRDVEVVPGRPGFRVYSHDRPEESTDIAGVLVGVHAPGDRLWYVYVVGELDREEVTTIRLAALSQPGGRIIWRMGEDELGGANAYRVHRLNLWRSRRGDLGEPSPPHSALSFPNPGDQFTMTIDGTVVTVREETSGANWTLDLAEQEEGEADG
jgi:hypothetical protein